MDRRLLELDLKTSLAALSDLLMPRVCISCGRRLLLQEKHLCLECLADLPLTRFSGRSHNPMADAFNAKIEAGGSPEGENYVHATALFFYKGGYRNITKALKYRRGFGAGLHFSKMLASELLKSGLYADVDAVVPVPLHRSRKWVRGYNQASLIAREISSGLGAEQIDSLLERTRRTKTQTALLKEQKAANVSGAFRVRKLPSSQPRHILLVDDVFTTGATLYECYKALRAVYGPSTRISIATLAVVDR